MPVLESVRAFAGDGEPADDMTLLALRILAPAAAAAADRSPEMVARADG
jgi:hypothetical protein